MRYHANMTHSVLSLSQSCRRTTSRPCRRVMAERAGPALRRWCLCRRKRRTRPIRKRRARPVCPALFLPSFASTRAQGIVSSLKTYSPKVTSRSTFLKHTWHAKRVGHMCLFSVRSLGRFSDVLQEELEPMTPSRPNSWPMLAVPNRPGAERHPVSTKDKMEIECMICM